jgi:hypothetical protein
MLSVLIPTYNYNSYPLVLELHKQCLECKIEFEIICLDDCSKPQFDIDNEQINQLDNCLFLKNKTNVGRTQTRAILAEKSKFELLLFLDSDVIPTHSNFIKKYIDADIKKQQVIIGGIEYQKINIEQNKTLRYKYGIEREAVKSNIRNIKPYSNIFSSNMLIKKDVFTLYNFNQNENLYGLDVYFAYQLFINKIAVLHIENPIYHIGIEDNEVFIEKSMKSVENRKKHLSELEQIGEINSLLKHYLFLKKLKLSGFVSFIFKLFKNPMKKSIISKNPNLLVFDLYRLGYICSIK